MLHRLKQHLQRQVTISQGLLYSLVAWGFILGIWPFHWYDHWWPNPVTLWFAGLIIYAIVSVRRDNRRQREEHPITRSPDHGDHPILP